MPVRELTYVKAYNEALHQVMAEDEDVFVVGEDVAGYGGVFRMYDGLLETYGDRRMIDTPISEMAIVGLGVGAASRGLRPVVDIMFMDFLAVCLDQVVNQAAKMKFMFGGEVRMPMVLTVASGAGVSAGAQHSQSLEAWLAHTPGLKVAMPSSAHDAKGLMVTAVRDDNPVIMMLNKKLLGAKGDVPEEIYAVPFGQAATVREGDDVTVVALGRMAVEAAAAADQLAAQALTDPLTGVGNLRLLERTLAYELARHARSGEALSVVVLDLDDFKKVNDTLGHPVGDQLLREVGEVLRTTVRAQDTVARQGGDEFCVVAPATDRAEARVLADRIKQALCSLVANGEPVSASAGHATYPDDASSADLLLAQADLEQRHDKAMSRGRRGLLHAVR